MYLPFRLCPKARASKTSLDLDLDLANFYKRKINDLQADCCDGLNKIRWWFTESTAFASSFDDGDSEYAISRRTSSSPKFDRGDEKRGDNPKFALAKYRGNEFDSKSLNDGIKTLWAASNDFFSDADISSLMNELSYANECFGPSEIYQEMIDPSQATNTNLAF